MENRTVRKMAIALLVLIVLTPLGLLATGEAFGEWGLEDLMEKIGYAPEGMQHQSSLWNAPLPDYANPGENTTLGSVTWYVLSAALGVALCAGILYLFGKKVAKRDSD